MIVAASDNDPQKTIEITMLSVRMMAPGGNDVFRGHHRASAAASLRTDCADVRAKIAACLVNFPATALQFVREFAVECSVSHIVRRIECFASRWHCERSRP